jgi:LPPG:FO 2-phospho-L-lactate transferase
MTKVTLLSGGTGGAKLARGFLDVVGEDLTVIANTGDDIEIYGAHVSPDPDLVTYWLADRIDERGWGIEGDTFHVMDGLRAIGAEVWFNLGDQDLAVCIERARRLRERARLTDAIAELGTALGVRARVLPMCDRPVRTRVKRAGEWHSFQEFMIRARGEGPVEGVDFDGHRKTEPTREVLEAIAEADAIVIGPSNPVVSIGPILAVPGLRKALAAASAPVVAVSPIVGGEVLKGPTEVFMSWAGLPLSAQGIADAYGGVLDGIVADEQPDTLPALITHTRMDTVDDRRRVAEETLTFALGLAG